MSLDSSIDPTFRQSHDIDPELLDPHPDQEDLARFTPEEEAALLSQSHDQKATANALFQASQYSQAVGEYDKALSSCPNYLDYEIAVLKSNIAACHLKLSDWKAAVDTATAALDALDRLIKEDSIAQDGDKSDKSVVEIDGDDAAAEEQMEKLKASDKRRGDVQRIRTKALMRRAKAKFELGGWGNLQGAEDDYKALAQLPNLAPADKKIVQSALARLPSLITAEREKEMSDMMGKLKELGNGILKPFGLSTDNFKMTKDEATGGYSMQFNQNR